MNGKRRALVLLLGLIVTALSASILHIGKHSNEAFAAFYCAGESVNSGANPYRIEPLRACEHRVAPNVNPPSIVEPAPLPGYALLPFTLLANLPYEPAANIFLVVLLCAFGCTVLALTEVTGLPMPAVLGAFIVVDGFVNASFGETPPLAIGALAVSGLALTRGRDRLAAGAAAASMIEPHLGLAACISLLLWRPRTRVTLLSCAAVLLATSLKITGFAVALEYITQVLPIQARSESAAVDQYSLTWLAHILGASDTVATLLGSISFIVFGTLGILFAARVARNYGQPALLIFFPAAASTCFGIFIHDIQLPVATLAVLVIAAARRRLANWIAVVVLSVAWIPWWFGNHVCLVLTLFAVTALTFAATTGVPTMRRMFYLTSAAFTFVAAFVGYGHLPHIQLTTPVTPWPTQAVLTDHMQAGLNWGTLLRAQRVPTDQTVQLLFGKLVVWSTLLSVVLSEAFRSMPVAARMPGRPLPSGGIARTFGTTQPELLGDPLEPNAQTVRHG